MEVNEITEKVIGCIYKVSNTLGCGFAEKVYQNATCLELSKNRLQVEQQFKIPVKYEGVIVGEFFADIMVEKQVLIELKTVRLLEEVFTAQCLNYLRATGLPVCLLVNYYRPKVEIKRLIPHPSWNTRPA